MSDDPMQVEGALPRDLRFNAKGKVGTPSKWSPSRGFKDEEFKQVWPNELVTFKKVVVKTGEEGQEIWERVYVDFNGWKARDPMGLTDAPNHRAFPFLWNNPIVKAAINSQKNLAHYNHVISVTGVPLLIYTPLLFLMLKGVRMDHPKREHSGFGRVMSSTEIITAYLQVTIMLAGSDDEHVRTKGRFIAQNYDRSYRLLNEKFDQGLATTPEFLEYAEHLFTLFQEKGAGALRVKDDDEKILSLYASYIITYTLNWILLLEKRLYALADGAINLDKMRDWAFVASALPLANELYREEAQLIEPEIQKHQHIYLKLRQTNFELSGYVPEEEFDQSQQVCGISAHYLRTRILIDKK